MMAETKRLAGVIPAMVTPTTDDGAEIDVERTLALTRRLIEGGVHGLFPCASTGEAPLLSRSQRSRLVEAVANGNQGKLPLLVGVGCMSTAASIELAKDAERLGATHIVVLPQHFFRVSEDEMEAYFSAVADSVSIPTVLYNYPQITSGQNITHDVAARLSMKHNIVAIKDSSGDLTQAMHYIDSCGQQFDVFTGSETLLLSLLQHGGAGTICAAANVIPDILVRLYDFFNEGEPDVALDLQRDVLKLSPFWKLGTFPAAVKAACALAGTPVGPPILPVRTLDDESLRILRSAIEAAPSGALY